jgi:hypothetical protein
MVITVQKFQLKQVEEYFLFTLIFMANETCFPSRPLVHITHIAVILSHHEYF